MPQNTLFGVAILFLTGVAVCIFDSTTRRSYFSAPAGEIIHTSAVLRAPSSAPSSPPRQVSIPSVYDFLTNNTHINQRTTQQHTGSRIPILCSPPRSGGAAISTILGECHGLVLAGEWNETQDSRALMSDEKLDIVHRDGRKHVTVDLSTDMGRQRAKNMGLTSMAEVVVSHDLTQTQSIFTSYGPQGELWTWFRHPVQRQASLFAYLTSLPLDHPSYNPKLTVYGLADFARSRFHTPNAMMNSLLGTPPATGWTMDDLSLAKELLRQKAHIGILEHKGESLRRLLKRMGKASQRECEERLLEWAWPNKHRHEPVEEYSEAYQLLVQRNWLDIELYNYATFLFSKQGKE